MAKSTFTRTTTPPLSANPFQAFVTYEQARRAAKGAAFAPFVYGAISVLGVFQIMTRTGLRMPPGTRQLYVVVLLALILLLILLAWRIWVRPGPWKILAILALVAYTVIARINSVISGATHGVSVVLVLIFVFLGLTLNASVIALRGPWP